MDNTADIVARLPEAEKLVASSYTFSQTKDGNIMILHYGSGKLLSIVEMESDEILDYINRLEAMVI